MIGHGSISKILPASIIYAVEDYLNLDSSSLYNNTVEEFYNISKDIPSHKLGRFRGVGSKSISRFEDFIYTTKFFKLWEDKIKERMENISITT